MFFASMLASWYFIQTTAKNRDRVKRKKSWAALGVAIITSILFASCFYLLFRIFLYGSLSYTTANVNATDLVGLERLANNTGLENPGPNLYYGLITNRTFETDRYRPLITLSGNTGLIGVAYVFPILCFFLGSTTAFVVNWLFDLVALDRGKARFFYFLAPSLLLIVNVWLLLKIPVEPNPLWAEGYRIVARYSLILASISLGFLIPLLAYFGNESSLRGFTERQVIANVPMVPCEYCGSLAPESSTFCPECGESQT
jgi:hypothetical protein